MPDYQKQIIDKLIEISAVLGFPVEYNRPYEHDQDSLPCVVVMDGGESSVPNQSPYMWSEQVQISPIVEVLFEHEDPEEIGALNSEYWKALRGAIRNVDWSDFTSDNTAPSFEKDGIIINDKPGISGFSVTLNFQVDLD